MTEGIVGKLIEFSRWILESLFPGRFTHKVVVNLTAIYDKQRATLSKSRIGLIEVLEKEPDQKFSVKYIHHHWHRKIAMWFDTDESEISMGECDAILRDWENDKYPLVTKSISKSNHTMWQLNPEYEEHRTIRDLDRTIFQMADQEKMR